jgi:hypothetical protein
MTALDQKTSAIEKIRKLMEFSIENGATEGEIENALKLAQRLMMKHSLEQGDIGMTSLDVAETDVTSTWKDGMEAKSFEWHLLGVIAEPHNCRVIRTGNGSSHYYRILGFQADREAVFMAFQSVLSQVRNLTKTRYKESDRSLSLFKFTTSYHIGFMQGLKSKLNADREEYLKLEDKDAWGLIIVKKDALIEEYIKENMNIRVSNAKGIKIDGGAFNQGKADGSQNSSTKQLH